MRVTRDVVLDLSVEEVWQLLTDPDELAAWFAAPLALDLRPGGVAAFADGGTVRRAVVDEVVEGRRLAFTWDDGDGTLSHVTFDLHADEDSGGVRVAVTETRASTAGGIRRLPVGALWDDRLLGLEVLSLTRQLVSA